MMQRVVRINGKYYDTGTKNEDFKLACQYFQSHGMKNYYDPLEILDPTIISFIDKDPSELTDEERRRIIDETKNNVWFYFREINPISLSVQDIAFFMESLKAKK